MNRLLLSVLEERFSFKEIGKKFFDNLRGYNKEELQRQVDDMHVNQLRDYVLKIPPKSARRILSMEELKFYEMALLRLKKEGINMREGYGD